MVKVWLGNHQETLGRPKSAIRANPTATTPFPDSAALTATGGTVPRRREDPPHHGSVDQSVLVKKQGAGGRFFFIRDECPSYLILQQVRLVPILVFARALLPPFSRFLFAFCCQWAFAPKWLRLSEDVSISC